MTASTARVEADTFNITTLQQSATSTDEAGFVYNGENLAAVPASVLSGPTGIFPGLLGILASPDRNAKSLVDFDLSSIAGKTITDAHLELQSINGPFGSNVTTGAVTLNLYSSSADWTVNTVSYNSFPAGSLISQTSIDDINKTFSIDVTNTVKGWLTNPASEHGFLLTQDAQVLNGNSSIAAWFALGHNVAPVLVVNTVPEPSTCVLMGLALAGVVGLRLRGRRSAK